MEDDFANELILRFPSNHFTLEEFDVWAKREVSAFRAALVAYGDIFIETKTKQSSVHEQRNDWTQRSSANVVHYIDLSDSDIKRSYSVCSGGGRFLLINRIQELRFDGVTELKITYKPLRTREFLARIPITDLTQKSLQVTLTYDMQTHSYVPDTNTKWGSFFRPIKDKVA